MEPYYFKTSGGESYDSVCLERCMVKNNGTMVGSITCHECQYNKGTNKDEYEEVTWIKCSKIKEATTKI